MNATLSNLLHKNNVAEYEKSLLSVIGRTFLFAGMTVLALFSVAANSLLFLAIVQRNVHKNLRTATFLYVAYKAATHMICGACYTGRAILNVIRLFNANINGNDEIVSSHVIVMWYIKKPIKLLIYRHEC